MALVKILYKGEDLTEGNGTLISLADIREIEQSGLQVVFMS